MEFSSVVLVEQPKKKRTIDTKQAKYLRNVPVDNYSSRKINGNIHIHYLASADHALGSIQVYHSVRLVVD
jgi:hypothetical protein